MKKIGIAKTCFIVLLGWASCFSVASAQDMDGVSVTAASDWAVHSKTGRVFASMFDGNEVVEFSSGGEAQRIKVGEHPDEMVIKDDVLVVACSKATSLHAFDLKTERMRGVAQLNGKGPYAMFCSQSPEDNYVYCICNTGDAWWDGEIFQVDLRTMKVRKQVKIQGWGQSHAMHVAMSQDGKWIVPDARGQSSPSGADLMKVDAEALTFTQVRDYHSSFGPMVAGPMNRYWAFGSDLYTLDISKKVRSFTGKICAIHPKYDLVASLSEGTVILERLSDAGAIGRAPIEFPHKRASRRGSRNRNGFDPTIAFDLRNNLVFVGTEKGGDWIDLNQFQSDLRPLQMIVAPSSHTTLVDKPMRVPVNITNANANVKAGQAVSLAITGGPKGARIVDGNLVWTPTADDMGVKYFDLAITTADSKELDTTRLKVEVTLPKVELGFNLKTMKLSPNGKTLVAWGAGKGQENRHPAHTGMDSIAVINLETGKTIAKKDLPQGVRDIAIDDNYIFLLPASGNVLYRLNHELSSSKRQFLKAQPSMISKVSPKVVAIREERSFEYFDVEKMSPVKIGSQTNNNFMVSNATALDQGKIVNVNGRVTERNSGDLLRVAYTALPSAGAGTMNQHLLGSRNTGQKAWGRQISANGMLSNSKGSRISQPSNVRMATISEDYPVGILISQISEGRIQKHMISFCSLIDGTILQSSTIKEAAPGQRTSHYGNRNLLIANGKKILLAIENEVHFADIPASIIKSAPIPPHFSQKQKTLMQVGKTESFPLGISGSRDGMTFSLMQEYEGLNLDESSGEIQIDTKNVWDKFAKQATSQSSRYGGSRNGQSPLSSDVNMQEFQRITGKKLPSGMMAAQLPIRVSLRDAEGQQDEIAFAVIIAGSRKPIDDELQKAAQEREKMQAEARKRQEEAMRTRSAAQRAAMEQKSASEPGSVSERIDKIEARMRRIEAALDAVLKKLDE